MGIDKSIYVLKQETLRANMKTEVLYLIKHLVENNMSSFEKYLDILKSDMSEIKALQKEIDEIDKYNSVDGYGT